MIVLRVEYLRLWWYHLSSKTEVTMNIKNKKLLMLITKILLIVICIIPLADIVYAFVGRKQLNDKLEELKASTDKVFIVFNDQSKLEEYGIRLPAGSDKVKLVYTYDERFLGNNYHELLPPEVIVNCSPEGQAYKLAGNTGKELLSLLRIDKNLGTFSNFSGRTKILLFSKDKLLALFRVQQGQNLRSKLFPEGDVKLTKTSQKHLKDFFFKHQFPTFD
jgi:hypothetical protein